MRGYVARGFFVLAYEHLGRLILLSLANCYGTHNINWREAQIFDLGEPFKRIVLDLVASHNQFEFVGEPQMPSDFQHRDVMCFSI